MQPLFPVPSCVLFTRQASEPGKLPQKVRAFAGTLPRRDAGPEEAAAHLSEAVEPWPSGDSRDTGSPYRKHFRQGATFVPRRLVVVEPAGGGRLGTSAAAPRFLGRVGSHDKPPWKNLPALAGSVEAEFARPLLLGESIAPFLVLEPVLGIVPWDPETETLMDSSAARRNGFTRLSKWLSKAEELWNEHGTGRMSLIERIDYNKGLSRQFPTSPCRLVYTKSGTNLAAAIVTEPETVIDHKLYWGASADQEEARYLSAILNSDVTRTRVARYQSQGQFGARDFDKYVFNLPIPRFDSGNDLHLELSDAAERAEEVATSVEIEEGTYFGTVRHMVRDTLNEEGLLDEIDKAVTRLLA